MALKLRYVAYASNCSMSLYSVLTQGRIQDSFKEGKGRIPPPKKRSLLVFKMARKANLEPKICPHSSEGESTLALQPLNPPWR